MLALTQAAKKHGVPVFTVGVGQDHLTRDIQVDRVSTPRQALKGTSLLMMIPTAISGTLPTAERSRAGRRIGLGSGWRGRLGSSRKTLTR